MMHKALYPSDDIDYTCQEKKVGEDTTELKLAWMYRYEASKTT